MSAETSENEERQRDAIDFSLIESDDFNVVIRPRPGTRVVKIRTETTPKHRDVAGALFDMRRVAQLCKEYVVATTNGTSQLTQDALWMSAVVLYARCFNRGVRRPFDPGVLGEPASDMRRVHQHILDLRDKFIGHSVNSYEQTVAYGVVDLVSDELTSHGTTHFWANPMDVDLADKLERLAWTFYNVGERVRALLGIVVRAELAELDRAAIAKLPDLTIETPSVERAQRRRSSK